MKPVSKPFDHPETLLAGADFADSFSLTVSDQALDAVSAAQRVMGRMPRWIAGLMVVRNLAVWPFRLKTSPVDQTPGANIGMFPVITGSMNAVVLGLDDRHLDFRLLVEVRDLGLGRQEVIASTAVRTHNPLGRIYLAIVKPFHHVIVPAMLAQVLSDQAQTPAAVAV